MKVGRSWKWIAGLVIVGLIGVGLYRYTAGGSNGSAAAEWKTATVTRGDLTVSVSASGTIVPASSVEVKSRATGIVTAVHVKEGDRVKAAQPLVQIDDPDAAAAVRSARANLDAAVARLRQAGVERTTAAAQDAATVQQAEGSLAAAQARLAQVVAGTRPEEIAQAEQAVRAAQAERDLAQSDYQRTQQLFSQGFISRQQLDQALQQFRSAQANYESALAKLSELRAGSTTQEIAEVRAGVQQAAGQLQAAGAAARQDAVRAQEVAAAQAAVAQAQSTLTNTEQQLAETSIRAPVSGLVSALSVQVGQSVIGSTQGGTPVMTLAVDSPLFVQAMVDEPDIAQIRVGMPVTISVDALPDETFQGTTSSIAASSVVVNNVVQYEVDVRVNDPRGTLKLGMTADAQFIALERKGVLLVPQDAVRGDQTKTVLVVEGKQLRSRTVETGATDGSRVEITAGVREGEVVYLGETQATGGATTTQKSTNPFQPQPPKGGPPPGPPP